MTSLEEKLGRKGVSIRKKIAELVRPIVLRDFPFSQIASPSCFEPYRKYVEQEDQEKRLVLCDAFIKKMELIICGDICRDNDALSLWKNIESQFKRDFSKTYIPPHKKQINIKTKDIKKIIINNFGDDDFFIGKTADAHTVRFVKECRYVNRLFIDFDLGTFGPGQFTVYIVIEDPSFSMELSSLLCLSKRQWDFEGEEQCKVAVSEVHDLIKLVLPSLESKIRDAVELNQGPI